MCETLSDPAKGGDKAGSFSRVDFTYPDSERTKVSLLPIRWTLVIYFYFGVWIHWSTGPGLLSQSLSLILRGDGAKTPMGTKAASPWGLLVRCPLQTASCWVPLFIFSSTWDIYKSNLSLALFLLPFEVAMDSSLQGRETRMWRDHWAEEVELPRKPWMEPQMAQNDGVLPL